MHGSAPSPIATLTYSAFWFPRTGLGAYYHHAVAVAIGPFQIGPAIYSAIVACALIVLTVGSVAALRRMKPVGRNRSLLAAASIATVSIVGALLAGSRTGAGTAGPADKPHVIVLGVDSLRLEYLRRYGGQGLTPNLDRFLSRADLVRDTTTPAARTFSSWVAILTGRSPPVTGARFNLADRTIVSANPTIADVLRSRGYHTVVLD